MGFKTELNSQLSTRVFFKFIIFAFTPKTQPITLVPHTAPRGGAATSLHDSPQLRRTAATTSREVNVRLEEAQPLGTSRPSTRYLPTGSRGAKHCKVERAMVTLPQAKSPTNTWMAPISVTRDTVIVKRRPVAISERKAGVDSSL